MLSFCWLAPIVMAASFASAVKGDLEEAIREEERRSSHRRDRRGHVTPGLFEVNPGLPGDEKQKERGNNTPQPNHPGDSSDAETTFEIMTKYGIMPKACYGFIEHTLSHPNPDTSTFLLEKGKNVKTMRVPRENKYFHVTSAKHAADLQFMKEAKPNPGIDSEISGQIYSCAGEVVKFGPDH